MRTITLICGLLFLVACGNSPEVAEQEKKGGHVPPLTSDDSSPIIISDGSIHIGVGKAGRDHFKAVTSKKWETQATNYEVEKIYFGCQKGEDDKPPKHGCSDTDCKLDNNGKIIAACRVNLQAAGISSWELDLCENTTGCDVGQVVVQWTDDKKDPSRMMITSNDKDLVRVPASRTKGAELVYQSGSNDHLQTLKLTVHTSTGPSSYVVGCGNFGRCLKVDYCEAKGKCDH